MLLRVALCLFLTAVALACPYAWPASAAPQSNINIDSKTLRVRIDTKRICACFAYLVYPMYTLDIASDGALTYEGGGYTAVEGKHRAKVPAELVRKVVRAIVDGRNVVDPHPYRPTIVGITLTIYDGIHKPYTRQIDFDRDETFITRGHPIIDAVDDLVDKSRWVTGNDKTASSLAADGCVFSRTDRQAMKAVVGVAMNATKNGILDLLRRGAPISIAQQRKAKASTATNVLGLISKRGDDQIIEALLATELEWTKDELNDAAVGLAYDGKLHTVKRLLARGANPRAGYGLYVPSAKRSDQLVGLFGLGVEYYPHFGMTGLQAAASSGNPGLVKLMLRYDRRMRQRTTYTLIELAKGYGRRNKASATAAERERTIALLQSAGAK